MRTASTWRIRQPPPDDSVRCVPVDIDGIPGEWVLAQNADPGLRLLYLHGGGFISGSGTFYLTLAARISAAAGCAVLLPEFVSRYLGGSDPRHPLV